MSGVCPWRREGARAFAHAAGRLHARESGTIASEWGDVLAMLHPQSLVHEHPRPFHFRREYIAQDHMPKDVTDWVWIDLDFPDEEHVVTVLHPAPDLVQPTYGTLGYEAAWTNSLMGVELAPNGSAPPVEGVTIRPVSAQDDLARIGTASFGTSLPPDVLEHPKLVYVLAESGGGLAGHARLVLTEGGIGYTGGIEVFEANRRRGIGTALMHALHAAARAHGMDKAVLVPSRMAREAGFFEGLGYKPIMPLMVLVPKAVRSAQAPA